MEYKIKQTKGKSKATFTIEVDLSSIKPEVVEIKSLERIATEGVLTKLEQMAMPIRKNGAGGRTELVVRFEDIKELLSSVDILGDLNIHSNECELIRRALKKHNGTRSLAATELGISERTLYRKIKDFNLE